MTTQSNHTTAKASITAAKSNRTIAIQEFSFNCAVDTTVVFAPDRKCRLQVTGFQAGQNVTSQSFEYDLVHSGNGSFVKASTSLGSMSLDRVTFEVIEPALPVGVRMASGKAGVTLGIANMVVFV